MFQPGAAPGGAPMPSAAPSPQPEQQQGDPQLTATLTQKLQACSPQDAQALKTLPPEAMMVIERALPELADAIEAMGGGQPEEQPEAAPPSPGGPPGFARPQTKLGMI